MTVDAAGASTNDAPEGWPYRQYAELVAVWNAHLAPGKLGLFEALGGPVVMGRREGVYFEDAYTGRRFLNCHSNGGVFNLGHRNARVIAAVREALDHLDIGNHHFPSGYRGRLAARLAATTSGALPKVVFAASGGEACDVAIKAARAKTGRSKIISAQGGFHGHTGLSVAAGDGKFRDVFGPNPPGFEQVAYDDLTALERAIDDDTAAVLLESLPATVGMRIPSRGYLQAVRQLCTQRGACLVLDEIQSGLGRTGSIWSYQHDEVVPDALLTAKGLSGGIYPMAAALLTPALFAPFEQNAFVHMSTFAGTEIGCAAALAVLDVIEEPPFLPRVRAVAERLHEELSGLPCALRQRGLFIGLAFGDEATGLGVFAKLLQEGVFGFPCGNDAKVVQLLPPLVISDDEVTELVARVRRAVA